MEERGVESPAVDGDIQDPLIPLSQINHVEASYFRSGPLPAPEELARYNEIQPDLVDRIVRMAETDLDARAHATRVTASAEARAVQVGAHVAWIVPAILALAAVGLAFAGASVYLAALVVAVGPIFEGVVKIMETSRKKHEPPQP